MTLVIPYDEQAEFEVAGCVVRTPVGHAIAARVVTADDFYTPRYRRLFAACADLADVGGGWDSSDRIRLAAEAADVPEAEVRALVVDGSRLHDVYGEFAHRVADAARRRRAMAAAAEAFNAIGGGADVAEAFAVFDPFIGGASWAA